jgi:hypothetical protein
MCLSSYEGTSLKLRATWSKPPRRHNKHRYFTALFLSLRRIRLRQWQQAFLRRLIPLTRGTYSRRQPISSPANRTYGRMTLLSSGHPITKLHCKLILPRIGHSILEVGCMIFSGRVTSMYRIQAIKRISTHYVTGPVFHRLSQICRAKEGTVGRMKARLLKNSPAL